MTRKLVLAGGFVLLTVAGCANVSAPSPLADVAALEASLTAAEQIATAYGSLPECQAGGPTLCHKAPLLAKIKMLDNAAYTTVTQAQEIIQAPGSTGNVQQNAITAARVALAALTAVTTNLKVK